MSATDPIEHDPTEHDPTQNDPTDTDPTDTETDPTRNEADNPTPTGIDDAEEVVPTPRLRPGAVGATPIATAAQRERSEQPDRAGREGHARRLPVRVLLLAGLAVLVVLAAVRPGGLAAVIGVPLALVLPGAVLQPRFLPGLRTDPVTMWCLRGSVSLAAWTLTALGVGVAGIPVRSVWTVVVGAVLLAAVVVGDPDRSRYGAVGVRQAWWGLAVLLVAVLVALGGRGLVGLAGGAGTADRASAPVVLEFADPLVPLALAPTGARATVDVVVTNAGDEDLPVDLTVVVGAGLPWATVSAVVPADASRVVTLEGGVAVCEDAQQAVVSIEGAGPVTPLAAVVPGADGSVPCGSR